MVAVERSGHGIRTVIGASGLRLLASLLLALSGGCGTQEAESPGPREQAESKSEDDAQPAPDTCPLRVVKLAGEESRGRVLVTAHVQNTAQQDASLYVFSQEGVQSGSLWGALRSDNPAQRVPKAGLGLVVVEPNARGVGAGLGGMSSVCWTPVEKKPGEPDPLKTALLKAGESRAFQIDVSSQHKGKPLRAYVVSPAGRIPSAMRLEPGANTGQAESLPPTFGKLAIETKPQAGLPPWPTYAGTWTLSGTQGLAPDSVTIQAAGDGYRIVGTQQAASMRVEDKAVLKKGALVWCPVLLQGRLAFWRDGESLKLVWDCLDDVVAEATYLRAK